MTDIPGLETTAEERDQFRLTPSDPLWVLKLLRDFDRLSAALAAEKARAEAAQASAVDSQMRAFQWMVAHDKLAAGEPYKFPEPADMPNAIKRAEAAEARLAERALLEIAPTCFHCGSPLNAAKVCPKCNPARAPDQPAPALREIERTLQHWLDWQASNAPEVSSDARFVTLPTPYWPSRGVITRWVDVISTAARIAERPASPAAEAMAKALGEALPWIRGVNSVRVRFLARAALDAYNKERGNG